MFKTCEEVIHLIEQRRLNKLDFDNFKDYMHRHGDPHRQLSFIHVAGTNGKGSTLNYMETILQMSGYRVGTLTSPALETHLDRIRINNIYMEENYFLTYANRYYDSWIEANLSMFEIDAFLACLYFVDKNVDIAIFEVGLGGRLDATNIISPLVSIITNIGMDHMELLGDTYAKIAYEKAGIIKTNTPFVTAEQKSQCLEIFTDIANMKKADIYPISNIEFTCDGQLIHFDFHEYKDLTLHTSAHYQVQNAACALQAIEILNQSGMFTIPEKSIRCGLAKAVWQGRFEVMCEHPLIIIDGAHNLEGMKALCESLKSIPNLSIVFSVLKDKNFPMMLAELKKISDDIIICEFQNNRAAHLDDFIEDEEVTKIKDYREAIETAYKKGKPMVITGSLYFISQVRTYLMKKEY